MTKWKTFIPLWMAAAATAPREQLAIVMLATSLLPPTALPLAVCTVEFQPSSPCVTACTADQRSTEQHKLIESDFYSVSVGDGIGYHGNFCG